jgi:hypothetical protein
MYPVNPSATSFVDGPYKPGESVAYQVSAMFSKQGTAGPRLNSDEIQIGKLRVDQVLDTVATGNDRRQKEADDGVSEVRARQTGRNEILIEWRGSDRHGGFTVERRVGSGAWRPLQTVTDGGTRVIDANVKPETQFSYRVAIVGKAGVEAPGTWVHSNVVVAAAEWPPVTGWGTPARAAASAEVGAPVTLGVGDTRVMPRATLWVSLDEGIVSVREDGEARGRRSGTGQLLGIQRTSGGGVHVTVHSVTVTP